MIFLAKNKKGKKRDKYYKAGSLSFDSVEVGADFVHLRLSEKTVTNLLSPYA